MKVNKAIALLLFSSTIKTISLNKKLSMYSKDGDDGAADDQDPDILNSKAPAKPTEDLNDVTQGEMEEYANKLHDKAGADKEFTEDNNQKQQQAPTQPTTPNALPQGAHALTEKNMYHAPKQSGKKPGSGESMFVAANTKAWAKLPKDFSPNTQGGMSVNPKAPDWKKMDSNQYSQLFHDAADSAAKEFDRPYDELMKESEERKAKHDKEHEDDEFALPDMRDVLLQMRLADDNELLITEDDDDKKHKHAKKNKAKPISLSEAMSYTEAMTDQSNGVHGYQTQRREMSGSKQEEKTNLIEKSNEHYVHKKNFYEQILDKEKEQDPNVVHKLADQERREERARNPKVKKSTFEDIQDGNAPSFSKTTSKFGEEEPCETCPVDESKDLIMVQLGDQHKVLQYFNYI